MTFIRVAALTALLAGAAAVTASPASADDLSGTYAATATSSSGATKTVTWQLTPCGPDCRTLVWGESVEEMHRQGSVWTSTDSNGCTTTVDEGSLAGTFLCPGDPLLPVQAVKVS